MDIHGPKDYVEQTAPSAPSAGKVRIYVDSTDGILKAVKSNGDVTALEAASAELQTVLMHQIFN